MDEMVNPNCTDCQGLTPLLFLTWSNKSDSLLNCLQILLQRKDIDVNTRDKSGQWNAIMNVCRHYSGEKLPEIVILLLERGADVDDENTNALILVCTNYKQEAGLLQLVRLFLRHNINLNANDTKNGGNALFAFCHNYSGQ